MAKATKPPANPAKPRETVVKRLRIRVIDPLAVGFSAIARLFKSFSTYYTWSDGCSNQLLSLDEYGCTAGAPRPAYNLCWAVFLDKTTAVRDRWGQKSGSL